jgi:hypothetical protein
MDASAKRAELFTLLEKQPLILTQLSTGKYTNGDWELIISNKWVLQNKGKIVFKQP